MIQIEVNNRLVQAQKGETILSALNKNGVKVPTLCHMAGLFPSGACRMCVVEIEGQKGLIPSCAYPVEEGMKIRTHSERAIRARKTIIELLLSNHPDDCLYCVRNGNCELQALAEELGVRQRRYAGKRSRYNIDSSSPSIVRDPEKCILCGKCVRVCEEVQGVSAIDFVDRGSRTHIGTAFDEGLNISSCINCGQCIAVCPTGALREKSSLKEVMDALHNPDKIVIVQHAPAVSVSIGEEFGIKAGKDVMGAMVTALRRLGFDRVFDTSFSADLTVMEEASELVDRIVHGGNLPMMTSCSPAWIKFIETFYPDFTNNLSTCKSPQQMLGAITKSFFAEQENINPENIFTVSIMPCTAKKFEAERPEMIHNGLADIDAVLTTRELARMIRMRGLDLNELDPQSCDTPFGERSTAGKLFGASGGVMEAAIRSAYYLITHKDLADLKIQPVRGLESVKEYEVQIGDLTLKTAVVSGLDNARKLLELVKSGAKKLHFIEVMSCPGGCINGGGQPFNMKPEALQARMRALHRIDDMGHNRLSHQNKYIKKIYKEYLGERLGEKSHHLLHTQYHKRDVMI